MIFLSRLMEETVKNEQTVDICRKAKDGEKPGVVTLYYGTAIGAYASRETTLTEYWRNPVLNICPYLDTATAKDVLMIIVKAYD